MSKKNSESATAAMTEDKMQSMTYNHDTVQIDEKMQDTSISKSGRSKPNIFRNERSSVTTNPNLNNSNSANNNSMEGGAASADQQV